MQLYCAVGDCERETREGRTRCDLHEKRWQRGKRGAELEAPVEEELTPTGKLVQLALDLADADADDEVEYQRAEAALIRQAKRLAPALAGEAIRKGLERARKNGVRLGRPPRIEMETALQLVSALGSVRRTARATGLSRGALSRALGRNTGPKNKHSEAATPIPVRRLGRPFGVTSEVAARMVAELGSISEVARALGVARKTVSGALRRKAQFSGHQLCQLCERPFVGDGARYCSSRCTAKAARCRRAERIRTAARDKFDPAQIFERDGWRCQLCGKATPPDLRGFNHPDAPELDHVVAIANGGEHAPQNIQTACRSCNGAKGARP